MLTVFAVTYYCSSILMRPSLTFVQYFQSNGTFFVSRLDCLETYNETVALIMTVSTFKMCTHAMQNTRFPIKMKMFLPVSFVSSLRLQSQFKFVEGFNNIFNHSHQSRRGLPSPPFTLINLKVNNLNCFYQTSQMRQRINERAFMI